MLNGKKDRVHSTGLMNKMSNRYWIIGTTLLLKVIMITNTINTAGIADT